MTTIDDYSDFIGYDVVAQRRKSRDENNSSYCPGVIQGVARFRGVATPRRGARKSPQQTKSTSTTEPALRATELYPCISWEGLRAPALRREGTAFR